MSRLEAWEFIFCVSRTALFPFANAVAAAAYIYPKSVIDRTVWLL